jgi:hypothetical protein
MAPELVGRASEIPVVESLLAGIADGGGSLLVLGDPGIGYGYWPVRGCRARRSFRSPGCASCCGRCWPTRTACGAASGTSS